MPIVWTKPDGSIRVMQVVDSFLVAHQQPGEPLADTVLRVAQQEQLKHPDLADAVPTLVRSVDLPPTKAQRHKWRLQNNRVVVDSTVLNPPHPRQALLTAIDNAGTLADLKTILKNYVSSR